MDKSATLLEDSLLIIWNDRNSASRLAAMNQIYAADITFYESHEGQPVSGYLAINELIEELQDQWPAEFKFELTSAPKVNHQVQHIAWRLGIPGQKPAASGMDVALIDNHKIKALYLFLDASENA